jgi:hypothetical protein
MLQEEKAFVFTMQTHPDYHVNQIVKLVFKTNFPAAGLNASICGTFAPTSQKILLLFFARLPISLHTVTRESLK